MAVVLLLPLDIPKSLLLVAVRVQQLEQQRKEKKRNIVLHLKFESFRVCDHSKDEMRRATTWEI